MKRFIITIIKSLLGGIMLTLITLGIFYIIGFVLNLIENNLWLLIPLFIIIFYLIKKEFEKF